MSGFTEERISELCKVEKNKIIDGLADSIAELICIGIMIFVILIVS